MLCSGNRFRLGVDMDTRGERSSLLLFCLVLITTLKWSAQLKQCLSQTVPFPVYKIHMCLGTS